MNNSPALRRSLRLALGLVALLPFTSAAQDRLRTYPGYEQYQRMASQIAGSVRSGALNVTWVDATSFVYTTEDKRFRSDVNVGKATELPPPPADSLRGGRGGGGPERGRQFEAAYSPDSTQRAFYKDRNLWLSRRDGSNAVALTTEGSEKDRTKYGSASWVYGEELDQVTAMWWSSKGDKLAFYGFDEKPVPDYYLQMDQTKLYSKPDVEAYPKSGINNPVVELFVYDLNTRQTTRFDIRDGQQFTNDVLGHYVYNVNWTADGSDLT